MEVYCFMISIKTYYFNTFCLVVFCNFHYTYNKWMINHFENNCGV